MADGRKEKLTLYIPVSVEARTAVANEEGSPIIAIMKAFLKDLITEDEATLLVAVLPEETVAGAMAVVTRLIAAVEKQPQ